MAIGVFVVFAFRAGEPNYRGRSLTSWLDQYQNTPFEEQKHRSEAEGAVRTIGAEKALPYLLSMLDADDGPIRSWIIRKSENLDFRVLKLRAAVETQLLGIAGFEVLGTNGAPAMMPLARLLDDPRRAFVAVRCLSCIGKPAEAVLCQSLTHKNVEVRASAIAALAAVTDDVEKYIARVKPGLKDPEKVVRYAALDAIGSQTEASDLAVPFLLAALKDNDERFRFSAVLLLGSFATNAPRVIPALSHAVEDSQCTVALAALRTLVSVVPQEVLPIVLKNFNSSDSRRKRQAVQHLCDYPITAPGVRAALESAATDPDAGVSRMAQKLLTEVYQTEHPDEGQITNEPSWENKPLGEWLAMRTTGYIFADAATNAFRQMGSNVIPALLKRLAYRRPPYNLEANELNLEAACALVTMGKLAKPALPELQALIVGDDPNLALHAMIAMCGMGAETVRGLIRGLTNQHDIIRSEAAHFWGEDIAAQFPNESKLASPFLIKLLDDPIASVRMAATNALQALPQ